MCIKSLYVYLKAFPSLFCSYNLFILCARYYSPHFRDIFFDMHVQGFYDKPSAQYHVFRSWNGVFAYKDDKQTSDGTFCCLSTHPKHPVDVKTHPSHVLAHHTVHTPRWSRKILKCFGITCKTLKTMLYMPKKAPLVAKRSHLQIGAVYEDESRRTVK